MHGTEKSASGGSLMTGTLNVLAALVLVFCLQIHYSRHVIAKSPEKQQAQTTELITTGNDDSNTDGTSDTESETFHANNQHAEIDNENGDASNDNSKSIKDGSAQAEPVASATKYIGNSFSLKFHRPACPFAKVMRKSRRVYFAYRNAAIDAGQRPCRYCLPPWWLKVEAKLLNPSLQTDSGKQESQQDD